VRLLLAGAAVAVLLAAGMLAGCAQGRPDAAATAPTAPPTATAAPTRPAPVVPAGSTTVGFGDSITYNSGSWFRRVCRTGMLGRCVNAAARGDTTTRMLARVQRDVLARHPRTVLVMGGTNDMRQLETARATVARLGRIVRAVRAAGATAVLCAVPPSDDFFAENAKLNIELRVYARQAGVPLMDLNGAVAEPTGAWRLDLSVDGVHPNARAAALMAEAARRELPQALPAVG
jgi:hypothetical protein